MQKHKSSDAKMGFVKASKIFAVAWYQIDLETTTHAPVDAPILAAVKLG
jgi:hypothetical protein